MVACWFPGVAVPMVGAPGTVTADWVVTETELDGVLPKKLVAVIVQL